MVPLSIILYTSFNFPVNHKQLSYFIAIPFFETFVSCKKAFLVLGCSSTPHL